MSSSRKHSAVQAPMDQVSIITAQFWVSGTTGVASGPDMTGSWIFGTNNDMAIDFRTTGSIGLPSGSIRLVLPQDSRYNRVLDWGVSFEGTGTLLTTFAGTTGGNTLRQPSNYRIQKYGHNEDNGTFDFGFVTMQLTGSGVAGVGPIATGHMIGAVPGDEAHSTSPAATVSFYAIVRNTDRPT